MSAKLKEDEFRDRFDAGETLESLGFDLKEATIEEPSVKRVNVDFPDPVVAKLDRYAASMGITRQSLIKVWIFERLKEEATKPGPKIDYAQFLREAMGERQSAQETIAALLSMYATPHQESGQGLKKRGIRRGAAK